MSWQKQEQCWTEDSWQKQEQKLCSKKEKRCMQLFSAQPAFTVWWRNGKTVKDSNRSQKRREHLEAKKHPTEWCAANNVACDAAEKQQYELEPSIFVTV